MLWGEDNAEALAIATAVGHKLAIEEANIIFSRLVKFDRLEEVVIEEFRVMSKRRFFQFGVYLVNRNGILNYSEISEYFV